MLLLMFDATRLFPVLVVAAVFWTVWKLLRGTRHSATLTGHFVEVHVTDDAGEALALAEYLCEAGFTAVANDEPGPRSPATLSRASPGDRRPFVAVREQEVAEAVPVIAEFLLAAAPAAESGKAHGAAVGSTAGSAFAQEKAFHDGRGKHDGRGNHGEAKLDGAMDDDALDDEPFTSGTMRFVRGVGVWLVTGLVVAVLVIALVRAMA